MSNSNRNQASTIKVHTYFGSMYIHIDTDENGRPCGGSISHPGKEPESKIAMLVETLSAGLNEALQP